MALFVYRFSDYEHTAEREQFRALCKKLQAYYATKDEICIFIANYNIYGCELDGILIKQDAILAVEFKNYGGTVIAVENGEWKLSDGTVIKGGSKKTVYQQANINHIAVRNGFRDANAAPSKALKNINALIVFHQPIELQNKLSPNTQCWLHVCDETSFMEKVQDITSKTTDLSREDMYHIMYALNLSNEYLVEEYSTSTKDSKQESEFVQPNILEEVNKPLEPGDIIPNKKCESTIVGENSIIPDLQPNSDYDERNSLSPFITQIIDTIYKKGDYNAHIFNSSDAIPLFQSYGIDLHKEFLITVEADGISEYSTKLERFIHKEVRAINNNLIAEFNLTVQQHYRM